VVSSDRIWFIFLYQQEKKKNLLRKKWKSEKIVVVAFREMFV